MLLLLSPPLTAHPSFPRPQTSPGPLATHPHKCASPPPRTCESDSRGSENDHYQQIPTNKKDDLPPIRVELRKKGNGTLKPLVPGKDPTGIQGISLLPPNKHLLSRDSSLNMGCGDRFQSWAAKPSYPHSSWQGWTTWWRPCWPGPKYQQRQAWDSARPHANSIPHHRLLLGGQGRAVQPSAHDSSTGRVLPTAGGRKESDKSYFGGRGTNRPENGK